MRYDNFVIKPLPTGGLTSVSGALITVCTSAGTGTPCTPKVANIYSDEALTTPIVGTGGAGTTNSDSGGNFGFYAAPGSYIVTVTGTGITSYTIKVMLPVGNATGSTGNGANSGTQSFGGLQCKDFEAVKCVDSTNTQGWTGTDIGGWINAAYAALPSTGGEIHIYNLGNACMNFSTGISLAVLGKFPRLIGHGGPNGTPAGGACLNWTPTSGIAVELDYVPTNTVTFIQQHGLRDVTLWNNGCVTTGSCGGSAFAIDCGATGWGCSNVLMSNVSIIGFNFGFNNSNTNNVPGATWINPFFEFDSIAYTNGNNTNNTFVGGFVTGCTTFVQSTVSAGGEYQFDSMTYASNSGPTFDFTRSTAKITATWIAPHFEDSPAIASTSPHYITGLVAARIYGGTMETDQASGTQDWFISIATGGALEVHGLDLFSAGKTFTQAFLLNTTARANVQITNNSTTAFPVILGGAGAALSILGQVSPGNQSTLQIPSIIGISNFSGNTATLTADWTCGTAGTVASCVAATIIGSGGGVPLTFTLPLVAQSYTLECDGVVGQATAATANQWNLLTATNGATNVTANYSMATAAAVSAFGAVTDQASTTTTFQITPSWTLGGTATKMPFHIYAKIEGASASGTVVSLQLVAPTVADLVTIYRGASCRIF